MTQQKKQWSAIIIMIALFAMIAFVTNLCSPMAIIVKNDFGASNVLAQIGNYGNFIAYLVMGIPAGMLIAKYGYKNGSYRLHRYHRYFNPMVERSRRQGKRFLGLSDRSVYQRFHHVYFELRSQPDAQLVGRWRKQR